MDSDNSLAVFRERMYRSYSSDHAGRQNAATEAIGVKTQVVPLLPTDQGAIIVDIGCGQGTTVRTLRNLGYSNTTGVDFSPEQVELALSSGIEGIHCGDFHEYLGERAGEVDVVLATDVLEHCTRDEVLNTFDTVHNTLRPGGVFVARVPNAASPFVGRIQHGDFTHETSFTARSLQQICNVTGFSSVTFTDPAPVRHGFVSAVRWILWKIIGSGIKFALAAETGQIRGHFVGQTVIMRAVR